MERASRDTSSAKMAPTRPWPTSSARRLKPLRQAVPDPLCPRSSSMTSTRSAGQPSATARSLRAYCRAVDSGWLRTWRGSDWRRVDNPEALQVGRLDLCRSRSTSAHASARSILSTRVAHAPSRSCRTLTGSPPSAAGARRSVGRDCIHGSARRLGARLPRDLPRFVLPVQRVGDRSRQLQQPTRGQQNLSFPDTWRRRNGRAAVGPLLGKHDHLAPGALDVNVATPVLRDGRADEDELATAEGVNRQRHRDVHRRLRSRGGIL